MPDYQKKYSELLAIIESRQTEEIERADQGLPVPESTTLDFCDVEGKSLIEYAVLADDQEKVKFLVEHGAKCVAGLAIALRKERLEIAEYLYANKVTFEYKLYVVIPSASKEKVKNWHLNEIDPVKMNDLLHEIIAVNTEAQRLSALLESPDPSVTFEDFWDLDKKSRLLLESSPSIAFFWHYFSLVGNEKMAEKFRLAGLDLEDFIIKINENELQIKKKLSYIKKHPILDLDVKDYLLVSADQETAAFFESLDLVKDSKGFTSKAYGLMPLQITAINDKIDFSENLLSDGHDHQILTKESLNLLMIAVSINNINLVKKMLFLEFDFNQTDLNGNNVFHLASQSTSDILELLLAHQSQNGIDPKLLTAVNYFGETPQGLCIKRQNQPCLDLLSKVIDVPPMQQAAQQKRETSQRILIHNLEYRLKLHYQTSQYLSKAGCCNALSFMFLCFFEKGWNSDEKNEFYDILQLICDWDGSKEALTQPVPHFQSGPYKNLDELMEYWTNELIIFQASTYSEILEIDQKDRVKQLELVTDRPITTNVRHNNNNECLEYTPEQLKEWCSIFLSLPTGSKVQLGGGRHATSMYVSKDFLYYYDPNFSLKPEPLKRGDVSTLFDMILKCKYRSLSNNTDQIEMSVCVFEPPYRDLNYVFSTAQPNSKMAYQEHHAQSPLGFSFLRAAVITGDYQYVETLNKSGFIDFSLKDFQGDTDLAYVIKNKNPRDALGVLLSNADQLRLISQDSPLLLCCAYDWGLDVFNQLIDHCSDEQLSVCLLKLTKQYCDNPSPDILCCIKKLLEKGASRVFLAQDDQGFLPAEALEKALERNQKELMNLFVAYVSKGKYSNTCKKRIMSDHPDLFLKLLKENKISATFEQVFLHGSLETLTLFLKHVAHPDLTNIPLDEYFFKEGMREKINYLLSIDSSLIKKTNSEGRDLLCKVLSFKDKNREKHIKSALEILLQHGASLLQPTPEGSVLLTILSKGTFFGEIKKIVEKQPEILQMCDTQGRYPVHFATKIMQDRILAFLLQTDPACVNKQDADWQTPLHKCVIPNDISKVRLLIEAGADLSLSDKSGKTALDLAREHNHTEIIALLEAALQSKETETARPKRRF